MGVASREEISPWEGLTWESITYRSNRWPKNTYIKRREVLSILFLSDMQWPPWHIQVSSDHRLALRELEHISLVPNFWWRCRIFQSCDKCEHRQDGSAVEVASKHLHSLNQTSPSEKIPTKTAVQHVLQRWPNCWRQLRSTCRVDSNSSIQLFVEVTFRGPWNLPSSLRPLVFSSWHEPCVGWKALQKWWKHYLLEVLSPSKTSKHSNFNMFCRLEIKGVSHIPFNRILRSWPFLLWFASPASP